MSSYQASTTRINDEHDAFAVNSGLANSGRGEGTTTPELVAKFRFLNVSASLAVLLFHTLGLLLNPIRLALLLTSPARVLLESAAAALALALLAVEGRVPVLAERVLRRVDLDAAAGRAAALAAVGACIVTSSYLARGGGAGAIAAADPLGPAIGGGGADGAAIIAGNYTAANATDGSDRLGGEDDPLAGQAQPSGHVVAAVVQCALLSPTALIVLAAAAYTVRTMVVHADFAAHRHYDLAGGRPDGVLTPTGESGRRTWTASLGQLGGGGYQTVEY
mmetsp:Transcript_28262/g.64312  ORF Transcript_28262/g.64312 Transcript_28262/m.64312 type:complete len:277 (-) Transcript_28262:323-1153(-)